MAVYSIDSYAIRLWSSRETEPIDPSTAMARIMFYEGDVYRGIALFYADDYVLEDPSMDHMDRIRVHYNMSQFDPIVDMLRYEKPVFLFYYGTGNAGLQTGREPTGEEESQAVDALAHS
ncbi:MAG: hypothetical protein KDC54_11680 [Lewinella sp.]|nr:hypothetical protein [Lewinella sp.]